MTNTEQKSCRCVEVLDEVFVVIEPGGYVLFGCRTEEQKAAALKEWARKIHEFFRDHRHQDVNSVEVRENMKTVCSACGKPWETADYPANENGPACIGCAWCAVPVADHRPAEATG